LAPTSAQSTVVSRSPLVGVYPGAHPAPYIRLERRQQPRSARTAPDLARRVLNVLAALVGIILSAPLMLLIAAAIRLTSRGPVFYTQPRVGIDRRSGQDRRGRRASAGRRQGDRGGRLFKIYKFRTMDPTKGQNGQVWATKDDPRITAIGHVLRKYRLDELPQLFNVLKGDMNIVGPRPEQPEIFGQLRTSVDRYVERQRVLPGITGWAQVNHSYDQSLEDVRRKVQLDLEYIRSRSAVHDLRIMALTLPVMAGKRGAI
jgi:lipopolysaccharide/colanic/teichoic acid biosynthesis glycosyltransferase